jgi:hypothetical protein
MWTVPPRKTQKLRVEVPMQVTVPDGGAKRTVDLQAMQTVFLRLVDERQQATDSKFQRGQL